MGARHSRAISPRAIAYFETHIRPLLAANCYGCHSAKLDKPMGGLLLDSRAGMLRGGKSGVPAIVPGKPEESLLLGRRARQQQGPAHAAGQAAASVRNRASSPRGSRWARPIRAREAAPLPAHPPPTIGTRSKQHWAFRPVADPEPPTVTAPEWSRLADRRVSSKPSSTKRDSRRSRAPRSIALIRRATYDLTGLPPTPGEVDAFLKDISPNAFEKVVDRLLASQQYGERWGRHWLDVVRYADTAGDNSDFPVPSMFRYRNWVIAAFNKDKPYDQFLREQTRRRHLLDATIWSQEQGRLAAEDHRHRLPRHLAPLRLAHTRNSTSPSTTRSTTSARACSA